MALGAWFMARSISELKCWVSCHSLVHASYIAFRIWHPVLMCALDFWLHAVSICCAGATNVNDIDWTTRKNTAFADHLLKTLGKGAESCQGIQEAAQCVVEESNGNCSELTKRFARIGTSGTNPQNCERDLFRLINLLVESWLYVFSFYIYIYVCLLQQRNLIYQFGQSLPKDPVFVTIPVKDKIKKNRVRYLRCPVILLHEVVHHVASTDQFHVDSQELQEFWRLWSLHKPHHPAAAQGLHWPLGLEVMMQSTAWLAAKLSLSAWAILFDRKCRRESHRGKTPMMVDSCLVMKCRFFSFWWGQYFLNPHWSNMVSLDSLSEMTWPSTGDYFLLDWDTKFHWAIDLWIRSIVS